jgi:hypothetical protein
MADLISCVYVDSTNKTVVSASNRDFRVDLVLPIFLEVGSSVRVEGLILCHIWDIIDECNNPSSRKLTMKILPSTKSLSLNTKTTTSAHSHLKLSASSTCTHGSQMTNGLSRVMIRGA